MRRTPCSIWSFCGAMIALSIAGCRTAAPPGQQPGDGKYDSEFPSRPSAESLGQISESVRMVSAIAYYRSLVFPPESRITTGDIANQIVWKGIERVVFLNRSSSGTALILHAEGRHLALLTCAHVVEFADTLFEYYFDENQKRTPYLRSVAFKQDEEIYVAGITGARHLEILAMDHTNDIALIGRQVESDISMTAPVFPYPLGKSRELEWGDFVYVFGYPFGYRMVTQAIVSSPNRDRNGAFLIDSGTKRGFSGGAVLAIRDGIPNYELVGLVRSAKGPMELYVTPSKDGDTPDYDATEPYKGDLYVDRRTDNDYGVAEAVPAEAIRDFLRAHASSLHDAGYDISISN